MKPFSYIFFAPLRYAKFILTFDIVKRAYVVELIGKVGNWGIGPMRKTEQEVIQLPSAQVSLSELKAFGAICISRLAELQIQLIDNLCKKKLVSFHLPQFTF